MTGGGGRGIKQGIGVGDDNELEEGEHSAKCDVEVNYSFNSLDERVKKVRRYLKKKMDLTIMCAGSRDRFMGYGSFLDDFAHCCPFIKSSPRLHCGHKTEGVYLEHTSTVLTKGASQKLGITASIPLENNSTSIAEPLDLLIKKNTCESTPHAQDTRSQCDLPKSVVNCNNKKGFKLRVKKKVAPVKKSPRKNTALYNGLGLASPTSTEESVDGESSSFTSEESPDEIFQRYTSLRVSSHDSPLLSSPKDLLLLLENQKEKEQLLDCDINISVPTHGTMTVPSEEILTKTNVRRSLKVIQEESKPRGMIKLNGANNRNVISILTGKEFDIESPKNRKIVSNALTVPLLHGSRSVDEDAEFQHSQEPVKDHAVSLSTTSNFVVKDKNQSIESGKKEPLSTTNCATNKFSNGKTMPSKTIPSNLKGMKGNVLEDDVVPETEKDVERRNAFKGKRNHLVGSIEPIKSNASNRVISCEQDGDKTQNRKKKFQKESNKKQLSNHSKFVKSNGNAGSSVSFLREKKEKKEKKAYDQLECRRDDSLVLARHNLESIPITELHDRDSNCKLPEDASNSKKDVWVQCDQCFKWRLLPCEINAEELPNRWICSMMNWLPEMNKCHVSEDETTNAVRQLYHDVAGLSLSNAESKKQSFSGVIKKKCKIKDESSLFSVTDSFRENKNFQTQSKYQEVNDKQTQQHKNGKIKEQYSDEGYLFDKNSKEKSNRKRGSFQDEQKTSKKQKLQKSHDSDIGRKSATNIVNGFSSKALGKTSQRCMDYSSSKDLKFDYKEKVPALRKKSEAAVHIAENTKVKLPTAENCDNVRKRNMKGLLKNGSQCPVNDLEEISEMTKAKKSKICRSDKQKSSGGDKFYAQAEKNSQSTKILISCTRDQQNAIGDSKAHSDMGCQLKQRNSNGVDSSKKDLGYGHPSTAATSISSKVSGCHKIKSSVSSVPFVGNQNGKFTCSTKKGFSVNNRISMGNPCDTQVSEANTKDKDLLLSKIVRGQYSSNLEEKEPKDTLVKLGGSSKEVQGNSYSISRVQKNMKVFDSTTMDNKNSNSKDREISRIRENSVPFQEDKKTSKLFIAGQMDKTEITPGKVKSANLRVNAEKYDSKNLSHQPETLMPRRDVNVGIISVQKDIIPKDQLGIENEANHNGTSNLSNKINNLGSVRKSGQSADEIYQEARALKHTARKLKNGGIENESVFLNFQSALKFLLAAFLWEDSQMSRSIQIYSETAQFFLYCANEYEKLNEVAASALAYKCVEVAIMKVTFFMNHGVTKDRIEPQHLMETGESCPSSAPDVENLSKINKAVSVKREPLITQKITFDVNLASEVSKKALIAFAKYCSDHEDTGGEAPLSVKRVVDFNFHDIEGFLRLVRLSLELIGN